MIVHFPEAPAAPYTLAMCGPVGLCDCVGATIDCSGRLLYAALQPPPDAKNVILDASELKDLPGSEDGWPATIESLSARDNELEHIPSSMLLSLPALQELLLQVRLCVFVGFYKIKINHFKINLILLNNSLEQQHRLDWGRRVYFTQRQAATGGLAEQRHRCGLARCVPGSVKRRTCRPVHRHLWEPCCVSV